MMNNEIVKYFIMILLTMVGIFVVKKMAGKYNIPVITPLAEGV